MMHVLDSTQSCWLWLSSLNGLGSRKLASLYQHFSHSRNLLNATAAELHQGGLSFEQIKELNQYKDNWAACPLIEQTSQWLDLAPDHHFLTINSSDYPSQLKHISDPPVILFVKGDLELLRFPQLAVIGSRKATSQGLDHAYRFSRELANQCLIPTSGLALGIDAKAHQGGLDARGLTIAVLGTGIDQIYPRTNQHIAETIIEKGGALVSEYLLGTAPISYNFPRRNRIISGLSLGCLVIEASLKSGSLITARLALEQGREVFALPGSIHNPTSRGCHQLIREGALLVDDVSQIYEAIGGQMAFPELNEGELSTAEAKIDLTEGERALFGVIGFESWSFDQLIDKTSLMAPELSQILLELELKGILAVDAGAYQRIHR